MVAKSLVLGIGILVAALIAMGTMISPVNLQSANAVKSQTSLTGVYNCDDGGQYYVTQIGNTLWWAGLSGGGDGHSFTNVYNAKITGNGKISGDWADVPRGFILNHGHLSLTVILSPSGEVVGLHKVPGTGDGFVGIDWHKIS
ncbi:MAG TPA: hypothetical protein VF884_01460 [Nitrososphaeraceae archaeon]